MSKFPLAVVFIYLPCVLFSQIGRSGLPASSLSLCTNTHCVSGVVSLPVARLTALFSQSGSLGFAILFFAVTEHGDLRGSPDPHVIHPCRELTLPAEHHYASKSSPKLLNNKAEKGKPNA